MLEMIALPTVKKSKLLAYLKQLKRYVATHDLLLATAVTIVTVTVVIVLGWKNNGVIPPYPKAHYHYTHEANNPLSFLSNWDGPDYLHIATHGYQHNLFYGNFFPLYPLLIHVMHWVVPSALDSAIIVSWLSLVGAFYFYIKVGMYLFNPVKTPDKLKALLFFILFPSGIFLVATYSESLYALLALGAIYFSLKKKVLPAALLLLLCTATHITGVLVVVLTAMILWEQKERLYKIILAFCVGCAGIAAYMFYSWRNFHDAFAFVTSQKQQHGWLQHSYISIITRANPLSVIFIILLIISAIYWWRRRRSFAVYSLLFLAIPLVGRQYGGFNRYVLMAFPLQFMFFEYFRHKQQYFVYIMVLMALTWTYFTLQYAGGYIGS